MVGADQTEYEGGGLRVPAGKSFGREDGMRLHTVCNDLGLDLWLLQTMQPWFISCLDHGVDVIRGTRLDPTNPDWFARLLEGLAHRSGLGGVFADGLRRGVDALDGELPDVLIELGKRLEFAFGFPAHREGRLWDPEPMPFWAISALMYASESRDPSIGTHNSMLILADLFMHDPEPSRLKFRELSKQLFGNDQAFEPNLSLVAEAAVFSQDEHMMLDLLPMCDFAFPRMIGGFRSGDEWLASQDTQPDLEIGARLLSAVTGETWTRDRLRRVAERVFNVERAMLVSWGRERDLDQSLGSHYELPCKTDGTRLTWDEWCGLLDMYYHLRGWSTDEGVPTKSKLDDLDLGDVADQMCAR
jgi:aldehyde:ferredoxin oxidoreductase